jgi:hypothetical protein
MMFEGEVSSSGRWGRHSVSERIPGHLGFGGHPSEIAEFAPLCLALDLSALSQPTFLRSNRPLGKHTERIHAIFRSGISPAIPFVLS